MWIHQDIYLLFRDEVVFYIKNELLEPEDCLTSKEKPIPLRSKLWWDQRIVDNNSKKYVGEIIYGQYSTCNWIYDRILYEIFNKLPESADGWANIVDVNLAVIMAGLRRLGFSTGDDHPFLPYRRHKTNIEKEVETLLELFVNSKIDNEKQVRDEELSTAQAEREESIYLGEPTQASNKEAIKKLFDNWDQHTIYWGL